MAKINIYITLKPSIDLGFKFQDSISLSIFYIFYNANLRKDSIKKRVKAQGFIDNISLIIISESTKNNNQKLAKIMTKYIKIEELNIDQSLIF